MTKPIVFIAGPLSNSPELNITRALDIAKNLIDNDFVPYVPHLSYYWNLSRERPREFWLNYHKNFLLKCDAFYMFGNSPGTDDEEDFAIKNKIPVFKDMSLLIRYFRFGGG